MDGLRKLLDEATPAPWNIGGRKNPKSGGAVAMVNSPLWESFARVVVRFDDEEADDAGGLANARLIAMAPDLAAALLKAEEALMRTQRFIPSRVIRCNGYKCRKPWCASCFDEDEAEEALEKAEADGDIARSALTEIRKLTGAA